MTTRISALDLNQINRQLDNITTLEAQVGSMQKQLANVGFQTAVSDPIHAPTTTNNLVFTWTGGSTTLSWPAGWIKDKNWNAQTVTPVPAVSSAPGSRHIYAVPSGSLSLSASTSYWLGWNSAHQQMVASNNASQLQGNHNVNIIAQITTGPTSQTAVIGGGGMNGGSDVSGLSYPNPSASGSGLVLPNGGPWRLQWGGPVGAGTTTFPIAFSGTPAVTLGNIGGSVDMNAGSITSTGFALSVSSGSTAYWIAIGPA